jgi:hypothetical protein
MARRQIRTVLQAANSAAPAQIEAMVAKTVKLPVSIDERLRRYCFDSRRTGQDVMAAAVLAYLDGLERQPKKG